MKSDSSKTWLATTIHSVVWSVVYAAAIKIVLIYWSLKLNGHAHRGLMIGEYVVGGIYDTYISWYVFVFDLVVLPFFIFLVLIRLIFKLSMMMTIYSCVLFFIIYFVASGILSFYVEDISGALISILGNNFVANK